MTKSEKVYTGVCLDSACTLGIGAEKNAIHTMIANGESKIEKIVCIILDGKIGGSPCCACRELIMQLDKDSKNIEIKGGNNNGKRYVSKKKRKKRK